MLTPHAASGAKPSKPTPPSSAKRKASQRQTSPEKDSFATCVSRTRRSRRTQREPRYWCTACEEPFIEKYDWKRHEETYQERRFVYRCNLCRAVYFLDKDFIHHHESRHNCETCQLNEHQEEAKQERPARTGWGCGFCTHFSSDWKERCKHIAQHFEEGKTMADWHHSSVIESLLQRPVIRPEWSRILQSQPQLRCNFGWNQHNTGRVEGFPEKDLKPHLQDLLERYKPGDNVAGLAQLAFRKIAFPARPPPAPSKDHQAQVMVAVQSDVDDPMWTLLTNTIVADDISPTGVCEPDYSTMGSAFFNTQGPYY